MDEAGEGPSFVTDSRGENQRWDSGLGCWSEREMRNKKPRRKVYTEPGPEPKVSVRVRKGRIYRTKCEGKGISTVTQPVSLDLGRQMHEDEGEYPWERQISAIPYDSALAIFALARTSLSSD